MFWISKLGKGLREKLARRGYRNAYVAEHVRRGVAYQIRALRDQRGMNQGALAKLLNKPQSVVSRIEDPGYGKLSVQTLLEVAAAFDVALMIKFVSHSTFMQNTRNLTTSSMEVPSFDADVGMQKALFAARSRSKLIVGTDTSKTISMRIESDSTPNNFRPESPLSTIASVNYVH